MVVIVILVSTGSILSWAFIRSASLSNRRYDELARKKFFEKEGGNERY